MALEGNTKTALEWYQQSMSAGSYRAVDRDRTSWFGQRELLVRSSKTHYFTVATENRDELKYLITSSKLAGIPVTVLGLGTKTKYVFSTKIELLIVALQKVEDNDGTRTLLLTLLFDIDNAAAAATTIAVSQLLWCLMGTTCWSALIFSP